MTDAIIYVNPSIFYEDEGYDAKFQCIGIPPGGNVIWTFQEGKILSNVEQLDDIIIIRHIQRDNYGVYTCHAFLKGYFLGLGDARLARKSSYLGNLLD